MLIYLRNVSTGQTFYLLNRNTFIIGRRDCDLLIQNDQSISKRHAQIMIKDDSVYLKDLGSRYKTSVKGREVSPNREIPLNSCDEIKFGVFHSIYRLEVHNYTICCSCIDSSGKARLKEHLSRLNVKLSVEWTPQCTHLTVSNVNLTIKLLLALLDEKPIVQTDYWERFVESVNASTKPPRLEDYLNPPIAEPLLRKISLEANPMRRRLFKGKLFIFFRENIRKQIEGVITKAGGASISWEKDKPKDLPATQQELIAIQVTSSERFDDFYSAFIEPYLASGHRLIAFEEIAHAIINCSCKRFCNPQLQLAKIVFGDEGPRMPTQSPTPLAGETESQPAEPAREGTQEYVPETMWVESELVGTNSEKRQSGSPLKISAKRVKVSRSIDDEFHRNEPSSSKTDATTFLKKLSKQSTISKHITSNGDVPAKKPPSLSTSQKRKVEDSSETPFALFFKKAKNQPEHEEPTKKTPRVQPQQTHSHRLREPSPLPTSSGSIHITARSDNDSIKSSRVLDSSFNDTWFKKKSSSKSRDDDDDDFDDSKNFVRSMNMVLKISDFNYTRDISKPNITLNRSSSGARNFKSFKKVMPLNIQRKVIEGSQLILAKHVL